VSNARLRWRLTAGLVVLGAVVVAVAVLIGVSSGDPDAGGLAAPTGPTVAVRVSGRRSGRQIPRGYLGLSFEYQAARAYTGPDAGHVNPVLVALIRNLSPGQSPVLRIGGDSTDLSWVAGAGVRAPGYHNYRLTRSWLATTGALARVLHARMIMGLNLAANEPALDRAEAVAFRRAIGARRIAAFEIGNEPNVYAKIRLLKGFNGRFVKARPHGLNYATYRRQFNAVARVASAQSLAGPALAVGPVANRGSWVQSMTGFLAHEPRLHTFTLHRYPLRNCYVPPSANQFPTVEHLLSNYATATLAASLKRWITIAHSQHRRLRLDELNSVACRGKAGISDTFASALWVPDALFSLAEAGVDGVNLHTLPKSAYELFHFRQSDDRWQGYVQPVYYGLQMFAQAAPAGARLMAVRNPAASSGLSIWATRAQYGTVRTLLVNKSSTTHPVRLTMPSGTSPTATVDRLHAPSVSSRGGVTLGGRTYGSATYTGRLAPLRLQTLTARHGTYTLSMPAGSAALVTFAR
jgi:hypothetical protein